MSNCLNPDSPDVNEIFSKISAIIEQGKITAYSYANNSTILMFWSIGQYINKVILNSNRAEYGKKIFPTLSGKLVLKYGKSFSEKNLYRMSHFADIFQDTNLVRELSPFLSWSHFSELIQIKNEKARIYYAKEAAERRFGIRDLRLQISRKAYERQEIANSQITENSSVPFNVFKDPYLLDIFGLKENFLESDLEQAILTELEKFILEFGNGFAFIERQKRIIMDDDDFYLDLLFYHRALKRLVAVELKLGKFKPQYKGQMEFYLKWLNKFERKEGEKPPIGLILCTEASRKQIELLEMDKSGIVVAEYWTDILPKKQLEQKIKEIYNEAKERIERQKFLPKSSVKREIDFFIDKKDDNF